MQKHDFFNWSFNPTYAFNMVANCDNRQEQVNQHANKKVYQSKKYSAGNS